MADIAGNLHILITFALILVVLLYLMYVIVSIVKRRIKVKDANKEISLIKMDLVSKQSHLQNLIEDSVTWSPRDLEKYEMTLEDTKLLRGKMDTGMELADVRTKRLELGNETHELFETLEKIKSYEERMFGNGISRGRGKK